MRPDDECLVKHSITGGTKGGITVRCGVKASLATSTAWGSEVSCPSCLGLVLGERNA